MERKLTAPGWQRFTLGLYWQVVRGSPETGSRGAGWGAPGEVPHRGLNGGVQLLGGHRYVGAPGRRVMILGIGAAGLTSSQGNRRYCEEVGRSILTSQAEHPLTKAIAARPESYGLFTERPSSPGSILRRRR